MASQELKHRTSEDEPAVDATKNDDKDCDNKPRRQKRATMARRGLRSLAVGVSIPLLLTVANIALFGHSHSYKAEHKPFWVPPLWALHSACVASALLMGLSAWLVWAEGGFHRDPTAIALFLGQLALGIAWDPVSFKMGAGWVGLAICLGLIGNLVACARSFARVNPIAGDLVMLCLAWAGVLTLVNLYLIM